MYIITATLKDGSKIEKTGTLEECAKWADDISLEHPGIIINMAAVETVIMEGA